MPSKTKSKKSKAKRSFTSSCWSQNDDGTLSLIIGSKNSSDSESSGMSQEQDMKSPIVQDCNGNLTNGAVLKNPHLNVQVFSPIKTPKLPMSIFANGPITLLKSNWSQNVDNYRQRQQIKRRDEMMAG